MLISEVSLSFLDSIPIQRRSPRASCFVTNHTSCYGRIAKVSIPVCYVLYLRVIPWNELFASTPSVIITRFVLLRVFIMHVWAWRNSWGYKKGKCNLDESGGFPTAERKENRISSTYFPERKPWNCKSVSVHVTVVNLLHYFVHYKVKQGLNLNTLHTSIHYVARTENIWAAEQLSR